MLLRHRALEARLVVSVPMEILMVLVRQEAMPVHPLRESEQVLTSVAAVMHRVEELAMQPLPILEAAVAVDSSVATLLEETVLLVSYCSNGSRKNGPLESGPSR